MKKILTETHFIGPRLSKVHNLKHCEMQTTIMFFSYLFFYAIFEKMIVQRTSKSSVKHILVLTWSPIVFLESQNRNSQILYKKAVHLASEQTTTQKNLRPG